MTGMVVDHRQDENPLARVTAAVRRLELAGRTPASYADLLVAVGAGVIVTASREEVEMAALLGIDSAAILREDLPPETREDQTREDYPQPVRTCHVEDLFGVFQRYVSTMSAITRDSLRHPREWQEKADAAMALVRKELTRLGIGHLVDWEERA